MNRNKYAWTWNIKPERLEEYVEMHENVWPEVRQAHSTAGIHNYSIFQNGNQFFYCFECDDVESAFKQIDQNEDCQRWNAITSLMVEGSFDFGEADPIKFLKEVFYLE